MSRRTVFAVLAVLFSVLAMVVGQERGPLRRSEPAVESLSLQGVVVETVETGTALEKAGVRTGDVLTSWESLSDATETSGRRQGRIASPFDWSWLKDEQAPRGTIRLAGERRGTPVVFSVEPGLWDASVRPRMRRETLDSYLRGRERIEAGQLADGVGSWREAAEMAAQAGQRHLECWLLLRTGQVWAESQAWEPAHSAFQEALQQAPAPRVEVAVLEAMGDFWLVQGELEQASEVQRSELEIRETWEGGLSVAKGNANLGKVFYHQGRLAEAKRYLQAALADYETLAPNSLPLATVLVRLGATAIMNDELTLAEDSFQRALRIQEELAPDSIRVSNSLVNLGLVAHGQGRLSTADGYLRRSLALQEKQSPGGLEIAGTFSNLAANAHVRGDLRLAADYYERALDIYARSMPRSFLLANTLNNYGELFFSYGDFDSAEDLYRRSMAILDQVAPGGLESARRLHNLGVVARARGNLEKAEDYYNRSLALDEKLAPRGSGVAANLSELGSMALQKQQLDVAEDFFRRSLDILEKLKPKSIEYSQAVYDMGRLASTRRNFEDAERFFLHALDIQRDTVANSATEVRTLDALGTLLRDRGELRQAALFFGRAMKALESQIGRLETSHDARGRFRAQYGTVYRKAVDVLLALGEEQEAFRVLESARAQALLGMIAERDVLFTADVPGELDEARRNIAVRYDLVQQQMSSLSPTNDWEEIEDLARELLSLRRSRDEVESRIREILPRLADLQYPKPLAFHEIREVLDPGVVLLSYSVGEETTNLFVVTKSDSTLQVERLPVGEEELSRQVDLFRDRISDASRQQSPFSQAVVSAGEQLYRLLVRPVEDAIDRGDRVLIVPDASLHRLPFCALIRETGDYVAEWRPLHYVLSATLYAELRRSRPAPGSGQRPFQLAAFGDPSYPDVLSGRAADDIPEFRVRSAVERGLFDWERLPYSRREVEEISGLYPEGSTRLYLGEDATEEQAKGIGPSAEIVHFAVHGYVDDRVPLDSGLALTLPEDFSEDRDNGLLQAWEIFESVRLDADLVVLSACQTALGEQRGGEGLIGLVRAFQYAGARTVVASLWNVSDQVTAELMVRFYRHLSSGKSKDEALQAAQVELIEGGPIEVENASGRRVQVDASAPYFWAGFQIIGDWQSRSP